jgi:hypothetical protein
MARHARPPTPVVVARNLLNLDFALPVCVRITGAERPLKQWTPVTLDIVMATVDASSLVNTQSSVKISSTTLYFRQGAMYKMDRDRTFANG